MYYCKDCSRMLSEDLPVCPHCGAEDENMPETGLKTDKTLEETITRINNMIQDEQTPVHQSDSYEGPFDTPDEYYKQQTPQYTQYKVPGEYRIGLIMLALIIPPCGIIFGALLIGKDNNADKKLGRTLLIIGVVICALGFVCCCAGNLLFRAGETAVSLI